MKKYLMLLMLCSCSAVPIKTNQHLTRNAPTNNVATERRQVFKERMTKAAEMLPGSKLDTLLLSTQNALSKTTDAAIVVMEVNGERVGLFFIFKDNEWQVIPDDFK